MNPAFRTCLRSVVCSLLLGLGLNVAAQPAPRLRTIAVVHDEPSWLATPLEAKVRRSLEEMAAGRMEVAFRETATAETAPDAAAITAASSPGPMTVAALTGSGITLGTLANGASVSLSYTCAVD